MSYRGPPRSQYRPRRVYGRGAYGPRKRVYRGRGLYYPNGKWANRSANLGANLAKAYGYPQYAPLASLGSRYLGGSVAKLFGSGRYTKRTYNRTKRIVRGRGAYSETMSPSIPQFTKGSDDSILIVNKEYICDILSDATPNTFNNQSLLLSPANITTFPWLSQICSSTYQSYQFEGLIMFFKSSSGDSITSVNTSLGSVITAVQYDASDAPLTSRAQLENTSWSQSCKPSVNMDIPVECSPNQTVLPMLYLNPLGQVSTTSPASSLFLGRLNIATTGVQGSSVNLGSLYVSYKVRLYKPIMLPPMSSGDRVAINRLTCTNAKPLGTSNLSLSVSSAQCDTLGLTIGDDTITWDAEKIQSGARFVIMFQWSSDSAAGWTFPSYSQTNGINLGIVNFDSAYGSYNNVAKLALAFSQQCISTLIVDITPQRTLNPTLTLTGMGIPGNAQLNIMIWQVNAQPATALGFVV